MLELLAVLTMIGIIVGAVYYLLGAVLAVVGMHLGGGRIWVQFGAWLTAIPVLVLLVLGILASGAAGPTQ